MVSRRGLFLACFFLFYIQMIFLSVLKKCKTILFADDTTTYKTGEQINDLYKDMNKELEILADWFHANL